MSSGNGATDPTQSEDFKGKGKAVAEQHAGDAPMDEDDDSSDDEQNEGGEAEEAEDNLEEIDLNNIVEGGRRTRGRVIDWAKAAEENPADDDDDEDEEDFEPETKEAGDDDRMDED
ncbi:histone chaperone domain CHZ-domain-containing protein [Microdochium bolleyi]|uniref:Histone chaperone domain CHZ-domain-containing protein n=1 Tax=Microdochium bolleyi TaxID=196109 RepID=A0A136JIH9_9PEZI|nr:histone chaperone domain CHZ-domain-containing protein [Microdochium bolleyi]